MSKHEEYRQSVAIENGEVAAIQPPTNEKSRNEFIVDCQQLQAEVDRLKAQRDELVAALEAIRDYAANTGEQCVHDMASDALSRIEVKP
jgi:anti-sigma factor RsiW